jgi:hypothetical protein
MHIDLQVILRADHMSPTYGLLLVQLLVVLMLFSSNGVQSGPTTPVPQHL